MIRCEFCGKPIRESRIIYVYGEPYHISCAKIKALEEKVKKRLKNNV